MGWGQGTRSRLRRSATFLDFEEVVSAQAVAKNALIDGHAPQAHDAPFPTSEDTRHVER
ncbi:hypothetical protein PT2222_60191 [Paraburkholderia tropica]